MSKNHAPKDKQKAIQGHRNIYNGASAESFIIAIFQAWNWEASKPLPDPGADVIAHVNISGREDGFAIAAQVKSQQTRSATMEIENHVAQRLKARTLPAFLFVLNRQCSRFLWVYIEPLLNTDENFSAGGSLRVPLDPKRSFALNAPTCPEDLLQTMEAARLRNSYKLTPRLSGNVKAIQEYYRELDPRLRVTPSITPKGEEFRVEAVGPPVPFKIFVKTKEPTAFKAFRELMDWGSVLDIRSELSIEGSRIFQEAGFFNGEGRLLIVRDPAWSGLGYLLAANGTSLGVKVEMVRGLAGTELKADSVDGLFAIQLRFPDLSEKKTQVNAAISFELNGLPRWQEKEVLKLRGLREVMDSLSLDGSPIKLVLLSHASIRKPIDLPWQTGLGDDFRHFRTLVNSLDDLLFVVDKLGIVLGTDPIGEQDAATLNNWEIAASLLKGRKCKLKCATLRMTVENMPPDMLGPTGDRVLVWRTEWPVSLSSRVIAEIPIAIHLEDYVVEIENAATNALAARPRSGKSTAYMSKWEYEEPTDGI